MSQQPVVVKGKDGLQGTVERVEPLEGSSESQVTIRFDNGQRAVVPQIALIPQADGSYYLPLSTADLGSMVSSGGSETRHGSSHESGKGGASASGQSGSDDLKSREYRDEKGEVHHHTRTYMEQHGGGEKK